MKFELKEKLAMVHIIESLMIADGLIHENEINLLSKIMPTLQIDTSHISEARNLDNEQSKNILNEMTLLKKQTFATILEDMAKSDGFVHEKEKKIMKYILSAIGIENQY